MLIRCTAFAFALPQLPTFQAEGPTRLPPTSCVKDEAAEDPSFVRFRQTLLEVVRARDAKRLISLTDPNVHLGQGEERGIAALMRNYRPEDPNSYFWDTLQQALELGGDIAEWEPNYVTAPSIFCDEDSSVTYDGLYTACILGKNVAARAAPSTDSAVIRRYSCARVSVSLDEGKRLGIAEPRHVSGWWPVLIDKRWGYVDARYVRFPDSETVSFMRMKGEWRWSGVEFGD